MAIDKIKLSLGVKNDSGSVLDSMARKLSDLQLAADAVEIPEELELKLAAGGGCDLSKVPGAQNWIEKNSAHKGLPAYIKSIACALVRDHGFSISHAIATAVSRVKVWAVSPETHPDTKAKATAAIAQWEAMRGASKGKKK